MCYPRANIVYDIYRGARSVEHGNTKKETKKGEKQDKGHKKEHLAVLVQFGTVSYPQNRYHTPYDRLEEKSTSTPRGPVRSDPRLIKNKRKDEEYNEGKKECGKCSKKTPHPKQTPRWINKKTIDPFILPS